MIPFVIAISCLSLVFAVFLARHVIQRDAGTAQMQQISNAIKEGAEAFLSRQNRTIISLSAVLAALIFVLYAFVRTPNPADPVPPVQLAFWTTLSFILGAACSVIAGYVGMWVSIRSNIRTASAVRSSAWCKRLVAVQHCAADSTISRIVFRAAAVLVGFVGFTGPPAVIAKRTGTTKAKAGNTHSLHPPCPSPLPPRPLRHESAPAAFITATFAASKAPT